MFTSVHVRLLHYNITISNIQGVQACHPHTHDSQEILTELQGMENCDQIVPDKGKFIYKCFLFKLSFLPTERAHKYPDPDNYIFICSILHRYVDIITGS